MTDERFVGEITVRVYRRERTESDPKHFRYLFRVECVSQFSGKRAEIVGISPLWAMTAAAESLPEMNDEAPSPRDALEIQGGLGI